jgi:hypothetical protein
MGDFSQIGLVCAKFGMNCHKLIIVCLRSDLPVWKATIGWITKLCLFYGKNVIFEIIKNYEHRKQ